MKNVLNIVILIFCLGLFLIPKQNFYAQTENIETCCETKSDKSDCCNHKKEDSNKSCQDNCCSACHTCTSYVGQAISKTEKQLSNFVIISFEKANFAYSSPSFSYDLKDIWQPPKIG